MASQIYDGNGIALKSSMEPSLTYSLVDATKINDLEAVKQAIYHILMTERYSNPIYDDDYGVELEQYIGADIGTIRATIETTLRDALTQDERIRNVVVTSVKQSDRDASSCLIDFTVYTIYGETEESITIS